MSFLFGNPYGNFALPRACARPPMASAEPPRCYYPRYADDEDDMYIYGPPYGPFFSQLVYGRPSQYDRQQRAYLKEKRVREQAELEQRLHMREQVKRAELQHHLQEQGSSRTCPSAGFDAHVKHPSEDATPMDLAPDNPAPTPATFTAHTSPNTRTKHAVQPKRSKHHPRPTKTERRRRWRAATVIQRWWRALQASRDTPMPDATETTPEKDRRDAAARVITQAVRTVGARKTTSRAVAQIKKLTDISSEADSLRTEFYDKFFTKPVQDARGKVNYALLGYVDKLEKLILKTDDIPTYGQERVRQERKATVRHIQSLLEEADDYRIRNGANGPRPAA